MRASWRANGLKNWRADDGAAISTPMAIEIERKFLVRNNSWNPADRSRAIRQGYLLEGPTKSLRIRRFGERYWLTVKAHRGEGSRYEFEYEVPEADGEDMLALCAPPLIAKTRHEKTFDGRLWEIDVFEGANQGLVLAEVELDAERAAVSLPHWVGPEVTDDRRFTNAALYRRPFCEWGRSFHDLIAGLASSSEEISS